MELAKTNTEKLTLSPFLNQNEAEIVRAQHSPMNIKVYKAIEQDKLKSIKKLSELCYEVYSIAGIERPDKVINDNTAADIANYCKQVKRLSFADVESIIKLGSRGQFEGERPEYWKIFSLRQFIRWESAYQGLKGRAMKKQKQEQQRLQQDEEITLYSNDKLIELLKEWLNEYQISGRFPRRYALETRVYMLIHDAGLLDATKEERRTIYTRHLENQTFQDQQSRLFKIDHEKIKLSAASLTRHEVFKDMIEKGTINKGFIQKLTKKVNAFEQKQR